VLETGSKARRAHECKWNCLQETKEFDTLKGKGGKKQEGGVGKGSAGLQNALRNDFPMTLPPL
jgi:hypothetical protein